MNRVIAQIYPSYSEAQIWKRVESFEDDIRGEFARALSDRRLGDLEKVPDAVLAICLRFSEFVTEHVIGARVEAQEARANGDGDAD